MLSKRSLLQCAIAVIGGLVLLAVVYHFSGDDQPKSAIHSGPASMAKSPAGNELTHPSGDDGRTPRQSESPNSDNGGNDAKEQESASIVVVVQGDRGQPVADAQVTVAVDAASITELQAITNARGECSLALGELPASLGFLKVTARGYSTYLVSSNSLTRTFVKGLPIDPIIVGLSAAATLEIAVVDELQNALPGHFVQLSYLGQDSEPSGSGMRSDGVQTSKTGVTNATGVFLASDLQDGWWLASCDRWRDKAEGQHEPVYAKAQQQLQIVLEVPSIELGRFASGLVVLPEPVPSLSGFMTINQYSIVQDGHGPLAHWLYKDGEFFIYGEPEQQFAARIISRNSQLRSEPFSLQIGRHGYRVNPKWIH